MESRHSIQVIASLRRELDGREHEAVLAKAAAEEEAFRGKEQQAQIDELRSVDRHRTLQSQDEQCSRAMGAFVHFVPGPQLADSLHW